MDNFGLHHATPTLAVMDPRGLAVRGVGYWRSNAGQAPQARVTRQVFDAAGRGVEQWDARLPVSALSHGFSLTGAVLATDSVDAGWRVSLWGQAEKTLSLWDSRGTRQDHEYDTSLRPTAVMEQARGEPVRVVERFEYGAAHLEVGNQCGQLIRHDDPAGTRLMPEYDLLGLAQSEISHFLTELDTPDWPLEVSAREALLESGIGLESRWAYNPAGNLLSLADANGHRRRFSYSVAGQLKEGRLQPANSPAPGQCLVHDIRYNPSDQVERETAGNGVITEAEYAPADGRLLRLAAGLSGASPVQDLRYEVDAVGNILEIDDRALPIRFHKNQLVEARRTFTYDSLSQLTSATGWEAEQAASYPMPRYRTSSDANAVVNYREEYDYDPAGNMTELRHLGAQPFTRRWAVAPDSNRSLLEEEDQPPDFDSRFDRNGNLRFLQRGQTMSWDWRNQLSSVSPVQRENEDDDVERYSYGGGGKRLRKVRTALTDARTVTTEVRYLPGLEIHLHNGAPTHQALDLEAGRNRVKWLQGPNATEHALRYHLTDHLGSGTLELDEQANVQSREAYYPFGGTAWEDHRDQSGAWKTLRYSGKERDATGLYYYGYRYFAPWLSRWISPDPAGAVDGLNLYGFVGNSPVGRVDRDGRVGSPARSLFGDESQASLPESLFETLGMAGVPHLTPVEINEGELRSQDSIWSLGEYVGPSDPKAEQDFHVAATKAFDSIAVQPTSAPAPGPSSALLSGPTNPLTCATCGKEFSHKGNFNQHLKKHTRELDYVCQEPACGKFFARKHFLTAHMRTHKGDKPFACTTCDRTFADRSTLSKHLRTHLGVRPYACEEEGCGKTFARKDGLATHGQIHTGVKSFACEHPTCDKLFALKTTRDNHALTHKPKQSCPVEGCPSLTSAPRELKRHLKLKHSGWKPLA
ncbi:RHS repeat-associated core domain-containing protein [Pseudomonas fluorescens]|uniref:RHS repeat-associated core domain-containing protein n=1 Tax=Pseudomonas fluorescens TaxID=294 RepID=UPI00123F05EC|nr:RHS repeat-associated core domain-containing protein [Pseudomonas fluorescens]